MPIARFEAVKSISNSTLDGTYKSVGSATTTRCRVFFVTNATDGDLMISTDASTDEFPVLAGVSVLIDVTANMKSHGEDGYFLDIGTQFSAKEITASGTKSLYIACIS